MGNVMDTLFGSTPQYEYQYQGSERRYAGNSSVRTEASSVWNYGGPTTHATHNIEYTPAQAFENHSHRNQTHQARYNTHEFRNRKKLPLITTIVKSDETFIVNNIYNYANTLHWDVKDYSVQPLYLVNLNPCSSEYEAVKNKFSSTNKNFFKATKIERVQNPFLLAAFLLKKEEMEARVGYQEVEQLFHGTKREHVMSICTKNFNWRLYGKNEGNKFGKGVSFTPISHYATYYGDEEAENRVMFLVNVLIGTECIGTPNMVLPINGTDTSIKEDGHVVVKYEDNEFYPAYKITYRCTNQRELMYRKQNKNIRVSRKKKRNQVRA